MDRPGRRRRPRSIVVRRAPGKGSEARVQLAHGVRCAALGRGGIRALKKEGDGATPVGSLQVRQALYRADRILRPRTGLPSRVIGPRDGWCDDPQDRNYNRLVRLPYGRRTESMMRDDALYDLVLVLGYNDRPRIRGRGSAIFAHLARPGYTPTDGCIALSLRDLKAVLAEVGPGGSLLVVK